MFKKILIANRGEIAVRIIKACKELGIKSAAIYSDADITSLHTRMADEAYNIGTASASESYLNKNKIIKLAKSIGADAIHPGYGFFSENASFIKEVEKSGITFIGPSSKSVKMMGSKTAARTLMSKHNVPVVPGTLESIKDVKEGIKFSEKIGFPILLKASAGGGGKGMRKVSSKDEFKSALESTKREALKSFANDEIYIEKFIENPKHIEVQIIADKFGNYRHVFERECSIQRRHQKIIEEAPSSFLDEKTREKITSTAIQAAKACGYFNAGTIEFLMDSNKEFYFLEMNTRIQVEHPVTELISGIDLVKEQILISADNKISFEQKDIKLNGYALECRIYAEDPENNFFPSTGKILNYKEPNGIGTRVDSGFATDSEISIHYDPMIAKLICWDNNRSKAISRMNRALDEFQIAGITTNIRFLKFILNTNEFKKGKYDINFIDNLNYSGLTDQSLNNKSDNESAAAVFAALIKSKQKSSSKKNIMVKDNKWWEQNYE
ncbi:MAG: acetyl-CoA carboxylase biotin carboxylase subunit [Ignavibacteriaceae bacterium]|nr:acetyl-CoA carboxylase biotin carboxylase subunit [Ignavibacterium sp.]MCC6254061.1 acetyl-CoA carboxylase biotin carboxylase subunit [Ignavibacteriaceae bacterium]HRN25117.1 acetyl-CoA carboxylase biotin carboxylase subunit [Ignavibacteriaceae bacterium]HRQ55298.1 acetyl-CoA carboxylase biotin carboxylase subunit [Ignavibacteriaceae bacterium]